MNPLVSWSSRAIASCGFLTYIPARLCAEGSYRTGAGLIGSLAGLFTAFAIPAEPLSAGVVLAGALCLSVSISDYAEEAMGRKDDPRIVLDEWIGYWFSVAFLPKTWAVLIAALILFRIFDVLKPFGIKRLSNLPGGWGVVMDDVLAGIFANLILQAAQWIHPF